MEYNKRTEMVSIIKEGLYNALNATQDRVKSCTDLGLTYAIDYWQKQYDGIRLAIQYLYDELNPIIDKLNKEELEKKNQAVDY